MASCSNIYPAKKVEMVSVRLSVAAELWVLFGYPNLEIFLICH